MHPAPAAEEARAAHLHDLGRRRAEALELSEAGFVEAVRSGGGRARTRLQGKRSASQQLLLSTQQDPAPDLRTNQSPSPVERRLGFGNDGLCGRQILGALLLEVLDLGLQGRGERNTVFF